MVNIVICRVKSCDNMTETGACRRLSIELNDKRECIEYRISKKWLERTLKEKLRGFSP